MAKVISFTGLLKAWSYSAYSAYKQCPYKVKLTKLEKRREPSTEAFAGGSVKHKQAENFIKGLAAPVFLPTMQRVLKAVGWPKDELFTADVHKQGVLPPELKRFAKDLTALKARHKKRTGGVMVEQDWAFTKGWEKTGWFASDAWLRVKLDCAYEDSPGVLILRDWKSGKFREDQALDYQEQLDLYAAAAFIQLPHIDEVRPQLDYLDIGYTHKSRVYLRAELPALTKVWTKRVTPMLNDQKFAPRPNRFCGWCHFRKENSGPCRF